MHPRSSSTIRTWLTTAWLGMLMLAVAAPARSQEATQPGDATIGPVSSNPAIARFMAALEEEDPAWQTIAFRPPRLIDGPVVVDSDWLIGPVGERVGIEIFNGDPASPGMAWEAAGRRLDELVPGLEPEWTAGPLAPCPAGRQLTAAGAEVFPPIPRATEHRAIAFCPLSGSAVAVISFSSHDGFSHVRERGEERTYVKEHSAQDAFDGIVGMLVDAFVPAGQDEAP